MKELLSARMPQPPSGPTFGRAAIGGALAMAAFVAMAQPAAAQEAVYDPLEPVNRAVFDFNNVLDGLLLEPASEVYGLLTNEPVRRGVDNVVGNLGEPLTFANDILQGEPGRAAETLGRFVVNSTVGVLGIFDVAGAYGYGRHDEDFGQTLAVWGVGDGPYVMLPLLGPSNARDTAGQVVDFVINPLSLIVPEEVTVARTVTSAIAARHDIAPTLEGLEANSLDFYAAVRTVYDQARGQAIRNGEPAPTNDEYEDLFDDFDEFE